MYAIAIDLGTTTLAASLLDGGGGRRVAMAGSMNPQRSFGVDVLSRLNEAVNSEASFSEMTSIIRVELRRLTSELCRTAGVPWDRVTRVAIAGNPAMQHILLGLPVRTLAFPPYRPLHMDGTRVTAADLGWEGLSDVYVFPMPGGFVGGDTVAFIYGELRHSSPPALFLDIGTNGELALLTDEAVWATSAAAGPAFEGGNLACGMAALPGAISSVQIEGDRVKLQVIGNGHPCGICGSAAIEAVAELLKNDVIEHGGRLRNSTEISSNLAERVTVIEGANSFVLYRDARKMIYLSQNDIRQLQLAKGAIRAGLEVLFERSRIRCEALTDAVLTGSFGAVLRPEWLKTVGIFNGSMLQKARFTSEGALKGVELSLLANDNFESTEQLSKRFRVVPLSGTPLFEEMFLRHIDFPDN